MTKESRAHSLRDREVTSAKLQATTLSHGERGRQSRGHRDRSPGL